MRSLLSGSLIGLTTRQFWRTGIEFIFELVFQFIVEVLWQILFEVLSALGWESVKASVGRERRYPRFVADIGHFGLGLVAGAVSVLVFSWRFIAPGPFPGISLLLSPLGTGLAMHVIGEWWRNRGKEAPPMFSFRGGAIFAFGMALVRFLYLYDVF